MKKFLSLLLAALLTASLVLPAGAAFVDVGEGRWYAGAVDYVTGHGLFQGIGGGKFDPYGTMTRGMFVLVLSRVAKTDVAGTPSAGFADVRPDKYYADAVNWAARNGYAPERSSGSFAPEEAITREEIAVILYNYLSKTGTALEPDPAAPAAFSDFGSVTADARSAVEYVRWTGLMNGSGGKFDPSATLTRAQAAEVFMRLGQRLEGAQEEGPEPSQEPQPDAGAFTVTTPSFNLKTTIYRTPGMFTVVNGRPVYYQIRITDPSRGVTDSGLGAYMAEIYGYTFTSSDPTVVEVDASGKLINPRQLAPGDAPVSATITVTNTNSGHSAEVTVTVSPDPDWYVFDDDYIAAYAAEALRLVNELRLEVGAPAVSYEPMYQEAINIRTARLEKIFAHDGIGLPHGTIGENISVAGANGTTCISGGICASPEKMAQLHIDNWATSTKGHYENMIDPKWSKMTIGIYVGSNAVSGRIYSALWLDR